MQACAQPPPAPAPQAPGPGSPGAWQQHTPPGHRRVRPWADRVRSLGTWALVLAIVELLMLGLQVAQMFNVEQQLADSFRFIPDPALVERISQASEQFVDSMVVIQPIRSAPFVLMTIWLIVLAVQIRRQRLGALALVRYWCYAAFGVLGVALVIDLFLVVPPTMEFVESFTKILPIPPGSSAAKVLELVRMFTMGSVIVGTVVGVGLGAVWPVVSLVWSGRLLKEAGVTSGAEPVGG